MPTCLQMSTFPLFLTLLSLVWLISLSRCCRVPQQNVSVYFEIYQLQRSETLSVTLNYQHKQQEKEKERKQSSLISKWIPTSFHLGVQCSWEWCYKNNRLGRCTCIWLQKLVMCSWYLCKSEINFFSFQCNMANNVMEVLLMPKFCLY